MDTSHPENLENSKLGSMGTSSKCISREIFSPHIFVCNINTLKIVKICISFHYYLHTDGQESLNTLKVKYLNDLLSIQISEQDMDAVTFFSVGDLFCIHLDTKYANFQEKISMEISRKNS